MGEQFFQYAMSIFFCAMSLRDYLRSEWHGAFYFLLAAGFLALWVELRRKNGNAVYKDCSWFVNPPPVPPDFGKENSQNGSNGGRNY